MMKNRVPYQLNPAIAASDEDLPAAGRCKAAKNTSLQLQ